MRHLLILLLAALAAPAEEWSRFRGPNGTGISPDKGFPVEFSAAKNLLWRTPVRAGKSSPVLTETRLFLTGFEKETLYVQCFDRATGKLLWERSEPRPRKEDIQQLNHPAAISPVTDGENVYVFFKDFGLLSYDPAGKLRWRVPLGPFNNTMGLGASPILAGDLLILQADQFQDSYIAAYSQRNGELRWKIAREESESWATPMLYQSPGQPQQIIAAGAGQLGGHSVKDGKRTFSYPGVSPAMVSSPVMEGGNLFAFGYGASAMPPFANILATMDKNKDGALSANEYGSDAMMTAIATYLGKKDGIITAASWGAWAKHVSGATGLVAVQLNSNAPATSPNLLWRFDKGFENVVPSPILYNGILYVVKNGGILTSYDSKTGELGKAGRVTGALGGYTASPVLADGRLYLASEEGKISVVRPGWKDWEVIQVNDLADGFFATPALSGGRIYARSSEALYCFGGK